VKFGGNQQGTSSFRGLQCQERNRTGGSILSRPNGELPDQDRVKVKQPNARAEKMAVNHQAGHGAEA
jgi:hypothetical protein